MTHQDNAFTFAKSRELSRNSGSSDSEIVFTYHQRIADNDAVKITFEFINGGQDFMLIFFAVQQMSRLYENVFITGFFQFF